jgi:hypothetical protein
MLVSNNEAVFRDVFRRLTNPTKIQAVETLAAQTAFTAVMKQTKLGEHDAQVRWFVDPFGYMELAQKIRDDEAVSKVARNDFAKNLAKAGFDAFRGIGGRVGLMAGEHELLHRTFIYARKSNEKNAQKVFDLFDFNVNQSQPLDVPRWVPKDASSLIMGNWNTQKALSSVGHFVDAQNSPGFFKRMLNDLKLEPNLQFDVEGVVQQFGNQFFAAAVTERPITNSSERVIIGCKLSGKQKFVFDNLSRANPDARVIKLGGMDVIEVDSTREPEDGDEIPDFDIEIELEDELEDDLEEEEEEVRFQLFEKRYILVIEDHILICNDKNYLRKILGKRKSVLGEAADFQLVKSALAKLTDDKKIAWRQFGRLDLTLETNYEMMRRNEMASSQTMLARVINRIFAKQAEAKARQEGKDVDKEAIRKQELDGATLPANFAEAIAPYLGPTGGVLEIEDGGWRMTGVMLKKPAAAKLAPAKTGQSDSEN